MSDASTPYGLQIMSKLGLQPDPWQAQVLERPHRRLLLNCSRQAGKSTVAAVLALAAAIREPGSLILLLSRSHRQSRELLRTIAEFHARLGAPLAKQQSTHQLLFNNNSRILSLPCQPETARGYSNVRLLVIDEAARVPDELYRTCQP